MALGYFAFAVFCLVVSLMLRQLPVGLAFTLAFAAALAVQIGLKALITKLRTPIPKLGSESN
jgi:hypothetical protein